MCVPKSSFIIGKVMVLKGGTELGTRAPLPHPTAHCWEHQASHHYQGTQYHALPWANTIENHVANESNTMSMSIFIVHNTIQCVSMVVMQ